jgi:peptidyl-prolyl cis-trans isomerase B (cyclophilin B)
MDTFAKKDTRVLISTKHGEIELKLYFEVAPRHCENFLKLAEIGFYNGTTFHRVNPPGLKVIQGGDPNSKGTNRGTHG